jgi:hypothetical protein
MSQHHRTDIWPQHPSGMHAQKAWSFALVSPHVRMSLRVAPYALRRLRSTVIVVSVTIGIAITGLTHSAAVLRAEVAFDRTMQINRALDDRIVGLQPCDTRRRGTYAAKADAVTVEQRRIRVR